MVSNNTQVGCGVLNNAQLVQKNIPHTITPPPPAWTVETRQDGSMLHVLYAKLWPDHLNVAAEIETHQTRQRFYNLLLSDFGEPVWIVACVSCSYLTGAAPGVVFCCWSPSASGFDVLCVQRWYSAYLGCNEWLFELLLPFYHLYPVCPFSSELWHQQGIFIHTTAAHWIFSLCLTILSKTLEMVVCEIPVDQQFLNTQTSSSGTNNHYMFKVT